MTNKIKRGKTGADAIPAMQEQGLVAGSREETAHSSGRPPRVSMQNMKKLEFPEHLKEDGFYYRWFQDRNGRVNQAQGAYFEVVADEQGNSTRREVGKYPMIFMRLPQEYRDEDVRLKKERVAATMEEEAALGYNEYAPDAKGRAEGGTSAISRTVTENPYS